MTHEPIEIRPAGPEDLPGVLDLLEVVAAEDAFIATEAPIDRVAARFRSTYLSGASGAAMFVAVGGAGAEVVGRISVSGKRPSRSG